MNMDIGGTRRRLIFEYFREQPYLCLKVVSKVLVDHASDIITDIVYEGLFGDSAAIAEDVIRKAQKVDA